ncbi:MAG TPA: hypothetical protein VFY28_00720 [Candidatus Paceibacterota bacterium]|nr:hypothetical protein [Candidatus Paceibacterota bacterium]
MKESLLGTTTRARTLPILLALFMMAGAFAMPLQSYAQEAAAPSSTEVAADPGTGANSSGDEGGGGWITTMLKNGMAAIVGAIAWAILGIASFVLWIVGGLFNWVVIRTVFEFGSYFGASDGLLIAWGIMRDIGNIVLLFGFIFMGIATILNTHSMDAFSARRALPSLIIFAVLLNFSLFASQAVIDVANGFASVFADQAGQRCDNLPQGGSSPAPNPCANVGIAGSVLQLAGIGTVYSSTDIGKFIKEPAKHAPVFVGLALFVTITAVVLLAGAIMLLIRAVILMFLMITSPIGFAGMAIPPLQKIAHEWWHQLINQSFFAPIYILLILISLKVVDGLVGIRDGGSLAAALINGPDSSFNNGPQLIMLFAIVIGFMVASLMIAKKMGAYGADMGLKMAKSAAIQPWGVVGRETSGFAGRNLQRINTNMRTTKAGRVAGGLLALGTAGVLSDQNIQKTAGKMTEAKMGTGQSSADRIKWNKSREKEIAAQGRKNAAKKELGDAIKAGDDAQVARALASMNQSEIEELDQLKKGTADLDIIARNLSTDRFKSIMDNKELDDGKKEKLRSARFGGLAGDVAAAAAGDAAAAGRTKRWSAKDLEQSGLFSRPGDIENMANVMSDSQYDDLMKSGALSNPQKQALKDVREGSGATGRFNPGRVATTLASMSPEAIAKLPGNVLSQNHVFQRLDTAAFDALQKAGKLDGATRQTIGNHIANVATTPGHPDAGAFMAYVNSDPRVKTFWNIP